MRIKIALNLGVKFSDYPNQNEIHRCLHACAGNLLYQNEPCEPSVVKTNEFSSLTGYPHRCWRTCADYSLHLQVYCCSLHLAFVCGQKVLSATDFNPYRFRQVGTSEMMHQLMKNNNASFTISDLNRYFVMYRCIT